MGVRSSIEAFKRYSDNGYRKHSNLGVSSS